ncbi:DUF2946 domain-containing protein [Trinickia fusca]|uniref:DUF2946 domain-containing protein n=1 Tax=Trinickia fusca TaxID=2419777 RepID=A0A494XC55_9BURK|nr:DUF2946 domain-containing protein [Trinickia fusca]RKP48170.1 DUF2946 domain-containing protein [Trinickia fusca]
MLYRHRSLTAWLGLLAIWLAIVGPVASQWRVAQAAAPDTAVCSAEHGEPETTSPTSGSGHHALHLDACGYCNLFTHSPAIGGLSAVPELTASLPIASSVMPAGITASVERYTRAYPRAPPGNA